MYQTVHPGGSSKRVFEGIDQHNRSVDTNPDDLVNTSVTGIPL